MRPSNGWKSRATAREQVCVSSDPPSARSRHRRLARLSAPSGPSTSRTCGRSNVDQKHGRLTSIPRHAYRIVCSRVQHTAAQPIDTLVAHRETALILRTDRFATSHRAGAQLPMPRTTVIGGVSVPVEARVEWLIPGARLPAGTGGPSPSTTTHWTVSDCADCAPRAARVRAWSPTRRCPVAPPGNPKRADARQIVPGRPAQACAQAIGSTLKVDVLESDVR